MLIVCVLSYFVIVKKIDIKCRNRELSLLPIWHHFSLVLLEGEVTSPYSKDPCYKFVRTSVTFVEFALKFCVKVSQVVYISATIHI